VTEFAKARFEPAAIADMPSTRERGYMTACLAVQKIAAASKGG